jgi:[acyl-carrier-protein] S-malonyltransferase
VHGKDITITAQFAKKIFEQANEIWAFAFQISVSGTEDDLNATNITQPAIFLHSI